MKNIKCKNSQNISIHTENMRKLEFDAKLSLTPFERDYYIRAKKQFTSNFHQNVFRRFRFILEFLLI